jgi:hypothetical protein
MSLTWLDKSMANSAKILILDQRFSTWDISNLICTGHTNLKTHSKKPLLNFFWNI